MLCAFCTLGPVPTPLMGLKFAFCLIAHLLAPNIRYFLFFIFWSGVKEGMLVLPETYPAYFLDGFFSFPYFAL